MRRSGTGRATPLRAGLAVFLVFAPAACGRKPAPALAPPTVPITLTVDATDVGHKIYRAHETVPVSAGTFPTNTGLFAALLTGVTVIVVGLTYFPVVALGPVVEHLAGKF